MYANSCHDADNITERDYLRTEGDPGAAGYTIKEALALTRSVVCYVMYILIGCNWDGFTFLNAKL
jgi:hypothetical protein